MYALSNMSLFGSFNALRAGLLTTSLLAGGCYSDDESVNPVEPVGPAPIQTLVSEDLALHGDGCRYGTASYTMNRDNTERDLIVAAQAGCPAAYFIEGSCNASLGYADGPSSQHVEPFYSDICYHPDQSLDYGMTACQQGALLCAVRAPGDRTETSVTGSGENESTVTETVYGPNRIDLTLYFRCCPSRP